MYCAECGTEIIIDLTGKPCPNCGSMDRYLHIKDGLHAEDRAESYDVEATEELNRFFEENSTKVFYSKQIEVIFERKYYHWVTGRALRAIEGTTILSRKQGLKFGGTAKFYYHKSNRYHKRNIKKAVELINEFSEPDFVAGLGQTGELLVNDGFTRYGFSVIGRNTNELDGVKWENTDHNLDFIFERDAIRYGVEVKNTLGYMDKDEFDIKIQICKQLRIFPLFVNRMMPSAWMQELIENDGVWLIMGHQLYPITHKKLAVRVRNQMKLPVDAPRALYDGTMQRILTQHTRKLSEI